MDREQRGPEGPQTNGGFKIHFGCGPPGLSGLLDIVHTVYPLATPLNIVMFGENLKTLTLQI